MTYAEPLSVNDSLQRAADRMREDGTTALPIQSNQGLIGIITEQGLLRALQAGLVPTDSVGAIIQPTPPSLYTSETGAQAFRAFAEHPILLVKNREDKYVGIIRPSDLLTSDFEPERPRMVGGMATPFGVYLTNGSLWGGVNPWMLILTGAGMITLKIFASGIAQFVFFKPWFQELPMPYWARDSIYHAAWVMLFFLLIRFSPIAGIHAAEHMTVHAIERGEPLVPEVVTRMPRVHPRCGTNIAAAALIFITVSSIPIPDSQMLPYLLGGIAAAAFYKKLGSFLQQYLTTRTPNEKQLKMGISAGKDLLEKYQKGDWKAPNIWRRILTSGIAQILIGAWGVLFLMLMCAYYVPGMRWLEGILLR